MMEKQKKPNPIIKFNIYVFLGKFMNTLDLKKKNNFKIIFKMKIIKYHKKHFFFEYFLKKFKKFK